MKIYNNFFNDYLDISPETGSYIGIRKYDKYYSIDIGQEYRDKYYNLCEKYLNELLENNDDKYDFNDIYIKCFKYFLESKLNCKEYLHYLIPLEPNDNYILNFIELSLGESYLPLETKSNYKNMINQLQGFDEWTNIAIENMKEGIKKNYLISKFQCKKLIEQINSIIKNKNYIPNKNNIPVSIKNEYLEAIDKYFLQNIILINNFLKKEYLQHCLRESGLYYLPNGKKYYQYLINNYTTLNNYTPEKIHKLGLSEVNRINQEMENVKNKLGFDGSLKDFKQDISDNPDNYYKNSDEILDAYKNVKKEIYKNIIPKYFNEKISHNYDIKNIPDYLSDYSSAAYYVMASYNTSRKGIFYLDSSNLKGNPKFETRVLSLHEGNPGHHFQLTYSIDNKIPKLFLYIMDNTAYIEGWGLYCERFIDENDLLNQYGRLNYEMMRATRLVIDTGIHHYGWCYRKAFNYYEKHCLSSKKETQNEILRYIASPGQALAYKIGEIFIMNLRDEFLKKNNDIKAFHSKFLKNGAMPLCLI